MAVVAPPGKTWDAEGNEEAMIRTPHGLAKYSERMIKVSKPKPKPKKQHKKFTSPAPDIDDEGVKAYQEKLKSLLQTASSAAQASKVPSHPEGQPEGDGVREYQDALKALVDTAPSEPAQDSMASPPRPESTRERQYTPEPEQPPSDYEQTWGWKHFIGQRYHGHRGDRPTTLELSKVIVVPKRPSPLSQVHNVDSELSTTPPSSPPHSPRLRPETTLPKLLPLDEMPGYMETLNNRPVYRWPLPRAKTPGLGIFHSAPPEPAAPSLAAIEAAQPELKIRNWRISNQWRDLSFHLEMVEDPSAPPL